MFVKRRWFHPERDGEEICIYVINNDIWDTACIWVGCRTQLLEPDYAVKMCQRWIRTEKSYVRNCFIPAVLHHARNFANDIAYHNVLLAHTLSTSYEGIVCVIRGNAHLVVHGDPELTETRSTDVWRQWPRYLRARTQVLWS